MRPTAQLRQLWAPACTGPTVIRDLVPGIRISVDPRTVEAFAALGSVFQAHRYHVRREDTGSYNCRKITGGSGYSLHAYGIAVDVNWNSNPYRSDGRLVTDMPPAMIEDVRRVRTNGGNRVFGWGGDYRSVKDAMHFEVVASPAELANGIDWDTVSQPERDPSDPATWPTIREGDRGPTVAQLQFLLSITVDGIFGPATATAVRSYQEQRGLTVDGIVGLQMWTALLTDQPAVEPDEPSPVKGQHRPALPGPVVDVEGERLDLSVAGPDWNDRLAPRHQPAAVVANGMDLGTLLDRIGDRLGPVMARLWSVLVGRALERLEEEAEEAIRERI